MYTAPLLHRIWIYTENQQFRDHFCLVLCCMTLSILLCTFLHFHSFPELYPKHKYEVYDTKVEKVPVILRADTASLLYQFFLFLAHPLVCFFLPDATFLSFAGQSPSRHPGSATAMGLSPPRFLLQAALSIPMRSRSSEHQKRGAHSFHLPSETRWSLNISGPLLVSKV